MTSDLFSALRELTNHFDQLEIRSMIGGSLASTTWGEPRLTRDVDLIADLNVHQVAPMRDRLHAAWYLHEQDILDAIQHNGSFNLIRFQGMVKIDVFIPPNEGFHASKWKRALRVEISPGLGEFLVTSAEDILLQKLLWFVASGSTSEQQWRDVRSLLSIQADGLDFDYLQRWASELQVDELLRRAREG